MAKNQRHRGYLTWQGASDRAKREGNSYGTAIVADGYYWAVAKGKVFGPGVMGSRGIINGLSLGLVSIGWEK